MKEHEKTRILSDLYSKRVEYTISETLWFVVFFFYESDGSILQEIFKWLTVLIIAGFYFLERKTRKLIKEVE